MRRLCLSVVSLLICCLYTTGYADIYTWIDEGGVKHFSNFSPPANAEVLMKTEELPYDEQADKERMEAERQERRVAAWQEIADKEAELLERQQAAERRIEAANLKAEQALREAEALLNEAEEKYDSRSNIGYWYYGYYHPYYKGGYYRKNGSIYYKYPHDRQRYKHHDKRGNHDKPNERRPTKRHF